MARGSALRRKLSEIVQVGSGDLVLMKKNGALGWFNPLHWPPKHAAIAGGATSGTWQLLVACPKDVANAKIEWELYTSSSMVLDNLDEYGEMTTITQSDVSVTLTPSAAGTFYARCRFVIPTVYTSEWLVAPTAIVVT